MHVEAKVPRPWRYRPNIDIESSTGTLFNPLGGSRLQENRVTSYHQLLVLLTKSRVAGVVKLLV
jgi:hypothetical protein